MEDIDDMASRVQAAEDAGHLYDGLPQGEHVQLYLSRGQLLMLSTLVRNDMKKAQRRLAKSTFVPEEGKRHGDEGRIARTWKLLNTLLEYAGYPQEDA